MSNAMYDVKTTQRHEKYFISSGDVVFMVENVFFRVHRYFFERESIFFKERLTTPASPGKEHAGTSEANAILLQDIRKRERAKPYSDLTVRQFEAFLWIFYNPRYSLYEAALDDWTWILDLADRWSFAEVKNLAVRELEKMNIPLVDRIVLYQDFNVDIEHLMPYYLDLCSRDEEIDLEIGERIGWKVTLRLQNARERALRREFGGRTPSPADVGPADMGSIIQSSLMISPPPTPGGNKPLAKGANANGSARGKSTDAGANASGSQNGASGGDFKPDSGRGALGRRNGK